MSKAQSIREMRREGETITAISQKLGVSRDTVYKYLGKDDFSPEPPASAGGASIMDQYRRVIEGYLEEDSRNWRKQRHTGRKIYERLRDEHGCEASESTVRHYVAKVKRERGEQKSQFLTLVWHPGEAQVDFGEADFYVMGMRRRLYFMAVSFPYSNVGLAQLFPGQNAECVCQGLKNVFEYLGGVPLRLVFDNATGVGRKVSDTFRTTDMFGAFAAHYGFSFSFCNPNSGHEKGNVERKVCFIRNSLFVPVPVVTSVESYNRHLPDRCMALSKDRAHWLKGEPEDRLFVEDQFALSGLPAEPFEVVKYVEPKTDKQGRFRLDGVHTYSTAPSLASTRVVVGVTAHKVKVYDAAGALVCEHARAYGDAPTDSEEPASQLALLCTRTNAWMNSQVRASLPEALGMEAVNAGYEVRFFTVANLVLHLQKLKTDGKLHGFMKGLQSAQLVILDEFGYVPIDIEGSRLLYQVVTECMKGSSMIITTNIEFGKWGTVLGDDKMAAAIVDRLVEHGRLVEFTGASHRMEHALMLGNRGS